MFDSLFKRKPAAYETVEARQIVGWHGKEDVVFVDVRGADEIARSGTIKKAIRAPLPGFANFAKPDGSGILPSVESGKAIVVVCASGMRSASASAMLADMGYEKVYNIMGGFGAWASAGGPVER